MNNPHLFAARVRLLRAALLRNLWVAIKIFPKNFLKNLLTFPEIVIYYNQKEGRTQDAPKVKNCKAEREDAPKVKNHLKKEPLKVLFLIKKIF